MSGLKSEPTKKLTNLKEVKEKEVLMEEEEVLEEEKEEKPHYLYEKIRRSFIP